jgi:hypothetical protein
MKFTPRTALVVIVAAIALMATAGAGATAALMISGKQIKDNSVTSQDIKNKSLKVKDLSRKAQAKLKGRTGATGATGARGPAGPAGPAGTSGLPGLPGLDGLNGLPGLSGLEVITQTVSIPGVLGTGSVAGACPAGKKAISATASYATTPINLLNSVLSQVTRTSQTGFTASGYNLLGTAQTLTLDVVCANVPS